MPPITRLPTSEVVSLNEPTRTELLSARAHAFCSTLLTGPPPSKLLDDFFTTNPRITEYGPLWATSRLPFLGRTFTGRSDCEQYFSLLFDTLEPQLSQDTFPGVEGFVADGEGRVQGQDEGHGVGVVMVTARGGWKSKKTGKSWEETFVYRLSGFDDHGKIGHWEIWADPLSAWEAVGE